MLGDGIKLGTTIHNAPPARLLDLTRSLRRAGRVATGVDRVEAAYLARFLASNVPCYGVLRTTFGYLLLDRKGLQGLQDRMEGHVPWARPRRLLRVAGTRFATNRQAEADLRKLAIARATPWRLSALLRRVPPRCDYYNVGHSNISDRMLSTLAGAGIKVKVLIHDVIPLEFPDFQRPGTVEPFQAKLKRVTRWADVVIYNSADTRRRTERQMQQWGTPPDSVVAHLGVGMPAPDASTLPHGLPPDSPYYVTVGTIEPRKNHALLLDIWDRLGPDAPPLFICGTRGWNNQAVFDRLDRLGPDSAVRELPNLSDAALAALVQGATAALFPSLAEGFGLPPAEALMLGTRVLCNDLEVLHEFLGDTPVYVNASEQYQWEKRVVSWAAQAKMTNKPVGFKSPTWSGHFNAVLSSEP